MNTQTLFTMTILGAILIVAGCTEPLQSTVQSQRQRNWLEADPAAISAARQMEEPRILPQTHFAAARLFEQQGQIEKAIIQYRKAIAVNHEYTAAFNRLGMLLGRRGRHADAEDALRRAVELRPDAAYLRNNLGFEYALQGRWTDAEAELSNALQLEPGFARAWVNLGVVLAKQQRFEEALDAFRTAVPEPDAFYNLGLMFRSQHRYRDAGDAFRHVLALNPRFTAAQQQLEAIAPQLALATPIEPVANVNQWPAVAKPPQPEDGAPAEQLADAGARAGSEPPHETLASPADDEIIATLTGSETIVPPDEAEPDPEDFEPCPDEEDAEWIELFETTLTAMDASTETIAEAEPESEEFDPCWYEDDDEEWIEQAEAIEPPAALEQEIEDPVTDEPGAAGPMIDLTDATWAVIAEQDDTIAVLAGAETILWPDETEPTTDDFDPSWYEDDDEWIEQAEAIETPAALEQEIEDPVTDEPGAAGPMIDLTDATWAVIAEQDDTIAVLAGAETILWPDETDPTADGFGPCWDEEEMDATGGQTTAADEQITGPDIEMFALPLPYSLPAPNPPAAWSNQTLGIWRADDDLRPDGFWWPILRPTNPELIIDESVDRSKPRAGVVRAD